MNFYNKFLKLCIDAGEKPSSVAEKAGLSRSQVTRWKSGKGMTDASAVKIANYFGVDPGSLLDDDSPIIYTNSEADEETLEFEEELQIMRDDPATRALLRSGRGLTKEQIDAVALIMKEMRRGNGDDN